MPLRLTLSTQGAFNKSIRQIELERNNATSLPSLLALLHFTTCWPFANWGSPGRGAKQLLTLMAMQIYGEIPEQLMEIVLKCPTMC